MGGLENVRVERHSINRDVLVLCEGIMTGRGIALFIVEMFAES